MNEPVHAGTPAPGGPIDFHELADRAVDPIVLQDGDRIAWANRAAAALVGAATPEAVVGRPVIEFVPAELREQVLRDMAAVASTGVPTSPTERPLLRLDGSRVPVEIAACALGPGRLLLVIRDVSRRQETEAARRSAERRLDAFFALADEAMGLARDNRYALVNPAFARLFGFDHPEEMVGRTTLEDFAPEERPRIVEYQRRRAAGEPLPSVYRSRGLRRDGTTFDAELQAFGFVDEGSTFTAAVVRDVTAQLAAERRLTESERRHRELFEFVPLSLWELDASGVHAALQRLRDGGVTDLRAHLGARPALVAEILASAKVLSVNAAGRAAAGAATQEELLAQLGKVQPQETFARNVELAVQLFEGQPVARAEGWSGTLDGSRRWIATTAASLPAEGGPWSRLLFASVDLTDRRRAEEERAQLHERLRQAEKLEAIGRLAGGIAHDFNNILSGILGYAELSLLVAPRGTDLHDHQQRIREAALRARDLVRQILAFSRRDRTSQQVVDVPHVVREALALMRAGIPTSVTLVTQVDDDAGATRADPTQLHQIVLNLCANARDAVGSYGRIEVSVDPCLAGAGEPDLEPGPYVRLRVRDDGAGMDEGTRARLFEPYMTTKGRFEGHGLGLAVVHGIVTAAGGAIRVDSAPGLGSTFDVYLPRAEPSAPSPADPAPQPPGRGERVLLVDDERMVRDAHRRALLALGYTVEVASDGEEALARFRATPDAFDVVLTDQTMPRLSGIDLARAILSIRPSARVLLVTGYSDSVDEETIRKAGLRGLLAKPVEYAALAAALRKALE
jgi:PAS domain S-box-containing protein